MQVIKRTSPFTGKVNEMKMNVTLAEIEEWQHGDRTIQEMLPNLSVDEREFLITGITPAEWDKYVLGED